MSVEDVRGSLYALKEGAIELTNEAVAVTEQERFASLPERCARAGALALELQTLLGGIYEDGRAYVETAQTFDTLEPGNSSERNRVYDLEKRARQIAIDSGSPGMDELAPAVKALGRQFHPVVSDVAKKVQPLAGYLKTIIRMASGVQNLGEVVERVSGEVAQGYATTMQEVDILVARKLNDLRE